MFEHDATPWSCGRICQFRLLGPHELAEDIQSPRIRLCTLTDAAQVDGNLMALPLVLSREAISNQAAESFSDPRCGQGLGWRTLLSSSRTRTDTLTSGIATCAPGNTFLCTHQHKHAEIYHVIEGEGVVEIEGKDYKMSAGTVVFIPGDVKHGVRNLSAGRSLVWLYVFAANDFDEVVYRFPHESEWWDGGG
jgi:quercetin dioxygenase-like cupin family protein